MKATKLSSEQLAVLRRAPLAGAPNKIRIALGLTGATQTDLTRTSGLPAPNLSDIVNGKYQRLALDTARRISKALGACIEDVFPPACAVEPKPRKRAA